MPLLAFNRKDTAVESIGMKRRRSADFTCNSTLASKRFHYGGIVAAAGRKRHARSHNRWSRNRGHIAS